MCHNNILNIVDDVKATVKREDGPWVEPVGALELQQSEGVYSDLQCGIN